MATKEFSAYKASTQLKPAAYTSTQTTAALDTLGYASVTYIFDIGVWTAGTIDFKLTECDTTGGSYTDVAAANFHAVGIAQVKDAATDEMVQTIQYTGSKRFLKAVATGATSPSAIFGIIALQTNPYDFGGAIK